MDLDMLQHPSTQGNLQKLRSFGNHLIDSAYGELASGLIGNGRMAEPEEIVDVLSQFFESNKPLNGKSALVTAGPTHEAIDPVRFIGNSSSGKMGIAIAEQLAEKGASVHLVLGPTHLSTNQPGITTTRVTSAEEMYQVCVSKFGAVNIAVLSAAVADYRPTHRADQKIKKADAGLTIELTKTQDIAAELGRMKKAGQYVVGFALETEHERANAEKKLVSKNFDLIVLNSLQDAGAGFGHDTNKVTLIDRKNEVREFSLKSKKEVAADIVHAIIKNTHA
jgi:phosphopantothenoylcysteine decarboxylase/phosphopantothenate--cysteine ligase